MKSMRLNHLTRRVFVSVLVLASVGLFLTGCEKTRQADVQPIRIGWQVAWATQGQIAMALQRTTALDAMGVRAEFKSFTYGAPLSEAALAGQLDVAFVGDQPAINLLSRSQDWKIVARLMDFRAAIVVPPNSAIQTVADLKGKTLGIPFGASTHRLALQWLKEAGLDPAKDLTILNIDITEQADSIKAANGGNWSKVDAFASWDHHIALYEGQKLARVLKSGNALGVVMVSRNVFDNSPKLVAFLSAYKLAWLYYATHQDEVNSWFVQAAGGTFDPAVLTAVAAIEHNTRAVDLQGIDIAIGDEQLAVLQSAADFALNQHLIKNAISISDVMVPLDSASVENKIGTLNGSTSAIHSK